MGFHATAQVKSLTQGLNGELLTRTEKLVLMVLAHYVNDELGYAWPSIATIARESLTSERHATRVLRSLERKVVIAIEHRAGESNRYRLPASNQ